MILEGKVSIITGGSMGIGKAIASAFAREGSHLVLTSRTESALESTKRGLESSSSTRMEMFPADVSQPKEVQDLIDFTLAKFNTIDVLVNCAGIYGPIGFVTNIDPGKWIETININLFGTFLCIRAVLPTMIKNKKGKIVNLSGGGATSPFPRFSAYSASKAAVVGLTETLAREVKEYNININAIAPGAINTRLLDQVLAAGEVAGKDFLAKSNEQKQKGGDSLERVTELALFLASPKSDGLSGKLISVKWDKWREFPKHLDTIMKEERYTLRRIDGILFDKVEGTKRI